MAMLLHEIWEEPDDGGQMLPGLCFAGPDGNGFRALRGSGSRLLATFLAASQFEAMTKYYKVVGYGEYVNDESWSREPYSQEAVRRQSIGRAV